MLGLGAAIDYQTAIGKSKIEVHNLALGKYLFEALKKVPRVRVVSAAPGPLASPLLTYRLPDDVPSAALHTRLLEKHHIEVKVVPANWFNGQRISTHLFNTEQDVDALVRALRAELG